MNTSNFAPSSWMAGYAGIAAGVLTLAGVPAAAGVGNASIVLLGLAGLAQLLWGTFLVLGPNRQLEQIGVGINAGAATIAGLNVAASGPGASQTARILLSMGAMALAAYLLTRTTGAAATTPSRTALGLTGVGLGSSLVMAALWVGAAGLSMRFLVQDAGPSGPSPTPTAHATAHAAETGHQGTYQVRLTGAEAGPYVVQAFTGPTEVGDLFVEVGVRDAAGAVVGDLSVRVEALPTEGTGVSVGGRATSAGAQVPGNYAIHLPVTSAGFWNVTLTLDGPLGTGVASFAERVGGTANIAGWVLAGVPLVIALLFGLLFVRTAGRRRG